VFENKIPLALIVAVLAQAAGIVWWVSQQAHTVESLKEDVGGLSSKMAIEQNVNLRRDVSEHSRKISAIMDDMSAHTAMGDRIAEILRRVSVIETELRYIREDDRGR
jgi:hypothetical protein